MSLNEKLNMYSEDGFLEEYLKIPLYISKNLNPKFEIRDYQKEGYARFSYYLNKYPKKQKPVHLLFNMATGSGKTLMMAKFILELYEKGYRNFLFFVNSTNIINKTKENFLNNISYKYLFSEKINFNGKNIKIIETENFIGLNSDDINIKFTTIQGLHSDLTEVKENSLSWEDFENSKIVFISDESHHLNAGTKSKTNEDLEKSWENTVLKAVKSNKENILLEFTATIDLKNLDINQKYEDKLIYKYDLKDFRIDGFSKEIEIFKSDSEQKDRILQAVILSQYRLKIAEKNNIFCKPVILFKAQQKIEESENHLKEFNELIQNLEVKDLENFKNKSKNQILQKAFNYFLENEISLENLVNELKIGFASENCISANDKKNPEETRKLLNSLEDYDNNIRAIFAVKKLDEGWDVLNLFDIVRMYDSRSNVLDKKTGKVKVGPQTIAEAQLIGRGARYFPFENSETSKNGLNKYKRKFDKIDEDLKILETFYYHTINNNSYISEIKQALRDVGLMDEKEKIKYEKKFKESFKKEDFYENGLVYVNERIKKDYKEIDSIEKVGFKINSLEYELFSGESNNILAFSEKQENLNGNNKIIKSLKISEIDKRITLKAIARNEFYRFDNLQKYLGKLKSIFEFIENEKYLGNIKIDFLGKKEDLENISIEDKLNAVSNLLKLLELNIKQKETEYIGTKSFHSKTFKSVFKEQDGEKNENGFRIDEEWFVFNSIDATSEEEAFLELFRKKLFEYLNTKYEKVFLVRNDRDIGIYSFDEGNRFEPDFFLFMKDKNGNTKMHYQIFIEPKGELFTDSDSKFANSKEGWKENFLNQISKEFHILDLNIGDIKIIGLPFYNKELQDEFEESFYENI